MAYDKLDTSDASKRFKSAQHYSRGAMTDPNDPASKNLLLALDHYFGATGSSLAELVKGMNDLLERVDRIEQLMKSSRP